MRRRIRSAAFPVHRHSVPQLLVDGILVALAYYLAFRLRFDGRPRRAPTSATGTCSPTRSPGSCPVTLVVLAAVRPVPAAVDVRGPARLRGGGQGRRRRHAGDRRRDRLPAPGDDHGRLPGHAGHPAGKRDRAVPAARAGAADRRPVPRAPGHRGAGAQLPGGQGRAGRADRRRRRRRPAGRPRADPQPAAAAAPGRLRRRRPAQAGHEGRARAEGARHHRFRGPGAGPRRGRARRGRDRDPLGPGHAPRPRGGGLPRARHPGAHDPDGVRAAQGQRRVI